jgi:hypothetical protein
MTVNDSASGPGETAVAASSQTCPSGPAPTSPLETKPAPPKPGLRKRVLFRLFAVCLGLTPVVAAEIVLRLLGVGHATDFNDPFVGFSEIHPLFVLNPKTQRYQIPASRQTHFCPESFAAEKPANEFRIFVLGGSTVQGRPYAIQTSFTAWLELSLHAADPSRQWEVVNCGGVSYATYRLVPILEEVLNYEPDLIIFCEGHNEFLEERSYDHIKSASGPVSWTERQVTRLRVYNVLRGAVLSLTDTAADQDEQGDERPMLGAESDAILDWKGGMAKYHRDPQWQRGVIAHFDFALRRIVDRADRGGTPLLLVLPPSNLEWPPFKCQHRDGITAAQRQEFEELIDRARALYGKDLAAALELLHRAKEIDDEHAIVHFEIGKCHQGLGEMDQAKEALSRARDLDVCPLRMLGPMKRILKDVAGQTGTPLVDAEALLAARCPGGIPGNLWLVDHVHPTLEGHQLIAEEIVAELARQDYLTPGGGWEKRRASAYQEHLEGLARVDPAYFPRGDLRLRAEQGWARGMTRKTR